MLGSRVRTGARQVRVDVVCWRTTLTHKDISGMADQCPPYRMGAQWSDRVWQ